MAEETQEPQTNDLVARAEAVAKRIEEANKKTEELLKKQEEARARDIIGGKSEAGKPQEIKKEIDPKEYALNALRGNISK